MPGMAGMAKNAETRSDVPVDARCCGCLGDCGTATPLALPAANTSVAVQYATPVARVPRLNDEIAPVVQADVVLPYPNAPPLSALI